eukprot:scaffold10667_cov132-Isochrysis_galbana.AAC.10
MGGAGGGQAGTRGPNMYSRSFGRRCCADDNACAMAGQLPLATLLVASNTQLLHMHGEIRPPGPMTAASTTFTGLAYGNGEYIASESSTFYNQEVHSGWNKKPIFGLAWSRRLLTRAPLLRPLRRTTSTWESKPKSHAICPSGAGDPACVTTEYLSRDPATCQSLQEPCTSHHPYGSVS